ncbi:MAG: hypothetical protein L3J69_18885, partial [Desulfobacula sp.]|nr:hypothetical protein [Desulfobacula sp.]
ILFATFITLIMVPCLYLILEDLKVLFSKVFKAVLAVLIPEEFEKSEKTEKPERIKKQQPIDQEENK